MDAKIFRGLTGIQTKILEKRERDKALRLEYYRLYLANLVMS